MERKGHREESSPKGRNQNMRKHRGVKIDKGFRGVSRRSQLTKGLCNNKSLCTGQTAHALSRKWLCAHVAEINFPLACFPIGACSTASCTTVCLRWPTVQVMRKVVRKLDHRLDLAGFEVAESLEPQLTSAIGTKANFSIFPIQIAEA